jgi:phosphopentomutase
MITRVILLVLDGLGVGAAPDASQYGHQGADTLGHLCQASPGLRLPNLQELGLGHIGSFAGIQRTGQPSGCFGRLAPRSTGVNSLVGHWELAGLVWRAPGGGTPRGLPEEVIKAIQEGIGRAVLGNKSGTESEILQELGESHLRTGRPILYVGSDADCHLAVHERIASQDDLYRMARTIRKLCKPVHQILRVVAHPFAGEVGGFAPTDGRKEFVLEPTGPTLLDVARQAGHPVTGIGRIEELFAGRGVSRSIPTSDRSDTMEETIRVLAGVPRGLLVATLARPCEGGGQTVNHRDVAAGLEEFDRGLRDLLNALKPGDLLCLTADCGRDGVAGAGCTREWMPLLVYGPRLAHGVNLGARKTLADVGQTIADALGASHLTSGESFLDALRVG